MAKQAVMKSGQLRFCRQKDEEERLPFSLVNPYLRSGEGQRNQLLALMHGLKLAGISLNRKMLAELAVSDKDAFAALVVKAKAAL